MEKPRYIDIHSHLNDKAYDLDREAVLERMRKAGVVALVVGTDEKMSKDAVLLAEEFPELFAVVGLHPTDTNEPFDASLYRELLGHPKTVAVGECGLDYFRMKEDTENERKRQRNVFESQLELSVTYDKPLMIHCREAHLDMLSILESKKREYGDRLRGNIHFFTADTATAKRYIELNFTLSFTGVVTFTRDYDGVVSYTPLSHIMSETDCPYVSPSPYRGTRNEPTYIVEVGEKIAEIRGQNVELTKQALVDNATRVFDLAFDSSG